MSDETAIRAVEASEVAGRPMRYFDFVMVAFVVILLLSNVIGAGKRAVIDLPFVGLWPFGAGILFFPLSYVIGDVLTEVYGFARARRCIWAGFTAMLFMVAMSLIVVALPPDAGWTGQAAYEQVFGQVPRIVLASIIAFWGVAGWPTETLIAIMATQFVLKVGWEVLLTPVTYAVVGWLKRKEGLDLYDEKTAFTPFALRT